MSAAAELTDEELTDELELLDALRTPATLAAYLDPDHFTLRRHSELIGEQLAGLGPGCDRLLLTTPPRVGKSTLAAQWLVFWWLIRHPSHKVVLASYGQELADEHSTAVRELVREHGARFGLYLSRITARRHNWRLTSGGGVWASGVDGGATGRGADLVVADDLIKNRAEADSRTRRDGIEKWWSSTLLSRLAPGAPVVLIMTRWHEDDIAARVLQLEPDRWRVVHLPALADLKLTPGGDPLGRAAGEPLGHPLIPDQRRDDLLTHWRDKRATSLARDWAALYQGDPRPAEGAVVSRELMAARHDFDSAARPVKIAVALDPSGGGRDVAGIIGGHLADDGRVYLTHDRSGVMASDQWARQVCVLVAEIGADRIVLERNFGGDMPKLMIRTAWAALHEEWEEEHQGEGGRNPYGGLRPLIEERTAKRNKLLRAEPVGQQWVEDRIRWGAYLPECEEEWCTWQVDDPDSPGRIDASVYLAYALLRVPGARDVVSSPRGISRVEAAARGRGTAVRRPY